MTALTMCVCYNTVLYMVQSKSQRGTGQILSHNLVTPKAKPLYHLPSKSLWSLYIFLNTHLRTHNGNLQLLAVKVKGNVQGKTRKSREREEVRGTEGTREGGREGGRSTPALRSVSGSGCL